jgi:tetratricopeptide (TPR) repeat protein
LNAPTSATPAGASSSPAASRTRTRGSSAARTPGSWKKPILIAAICGGFCLIALGVLFGFATYSQRQREEARRQRNEEEDRKREETLAAFRRQRPLAQDEIAAELKPFFKRLGEAFQNAEEQRIVAHFDADRMVDELLELGLMAEMIRQDRAEFAAGMRTGMRSSFVKQAPLLAWNDSDIKSIKKLELNEAVVIVRHTQVNGNILKMRWWVSKRLGTWKIYDMEDLDVGTRISSMMATAVGLIKDDPNRLADLQRTGNNLRDARLALQRQDADSADRLMRDIAHIRLTSPQEAIRLVIDGQIQYQRGQFENAIDTWDRAQAMNPDMPCVKFLKGSAYNRLGNGDKALKLIQDYRDWLGEDSSICQEIGQALRSLGRLDEARASYRKALDYNPRNADAFLGLLHCLNYNDRCDDLGRRFVLLDQLPANFEAFANECKRRRLGTALVEIARAMQGINPGHFHADYCLAIGLAWTGKNDEAMPLLKAVVQRADAGQRAGMAQDLVPSVAAMGKTVELYEALADPRATFRLLGCELKRAYFPDELRDLITAHAKIDPRDPLLPFFQADLHAGDENYALADKLFSAAMAQPPDDVTLALFSHSRVVARYHVGQALEALAHIEPKHQTFQDLAGLCLQDEKYDLLESLLDEYEPGILVPHQRQQVFGYRIQLKFRQNDWQGGVKAYKDALGRTVELHDRQSLTSSFLFEMANAGKALQGYEAADDTEQTLQVLGNDLLGQGKLADLKQIVAAHRQRRPRDPWLTFFDAQLALEENALQRAERILAEAWPRLDGAINEEHYLRSRCRALYVQVLHQRGLDQIALERIEPRTETYHQLANYLIAERKGAELEALITAQRPFVAAGTPDESALLFHAARAKAFLKQPHEALALLHKAYTTETAGHNRQDYLNTLMWDMVELGHSVDAYRAAPDPVKAFTILAGALVSRKEKKELALLLKEHVAQHAADPMILFYAGEMHLLRGEAKQAEEKFQAALAKGQPLDAWRLQNGLLRAQIRQGKVVEAYGKQRPGPRAFESLAHVCLSDKNAGQLEALLAVHRESFPDDPNVQAWMFDVKWLKQDYEGALKLLRDEQAGIFAKQRFRWKCDNNVVRCLVKLKRTEEAIEEAEKLFKNKRGNHILTVLASASSGDARQAIAAVEKRLPDRYLVSDCYRDPDLGPMLRGDAFADFRQHFPEPKGMRPGDNFGPFNDD